MMTIMRIICTSIESSFQKSLKYINALVNLHCIRKFFAIFKIRYQIKFWERKNESMLLMSDEFTWEEISDLQYWSWHTFNCLVNLYLICKQSFQDQSVRILLIHIRKQKMKIHLRNWKLCSNVAIWLLLKLSWPCRLNVLLNFEFPMAIQFQSLLNLT